MTFTPIDTDYNGYRFRSRLEARWAVFFDHLNITYQYEPEGFDLAGTRYLPDFHLPNGLQLYGEEQPRPNVWVEIKPTPELSDDERRKLAQFVKHTGFHLLLIAGQPSAEANLRLISYRDNYAAPTVRFVELHPGYLGLVDTGDVEAIPDTATRHAVSQLGRTQPLLDAYDAARGERFEHGYHNCRVCGRRFKPYREYHALCPDCYRDKANHSMHDQGTASETAASGALWRQFSLKAGSKTTRSTPTNRRPTRLSVINLSVIVVVLAAAAALLFDPFDWGLGFDSARQPTAGTSQPALLPTAYNEPTATQQPVLLPTPTIEPTVTSPPAATTLPSTCVCTTNSYNCSDFDTQAEAQACFDACFPSAGDIHILDEDADRRACEALP